MLLIVLTMTVSLFVSFAAAESAPETFNNVTDFSNKHGYKNWYYMYGDVDDPRLMVFDMDIGRWNGKDFYAFMEIGQIHPGNNTETFYGFKAPKDGTLHVSGDVKRTPTAYGEGDGVFTYIAFNNSENDYLFSKTKNKDDNTVSEFEFDVEVKAGDMLFFVTNASANNSYDNTKWNIDIAY